MANRPAGRDGTPNCHCNVRLLTSLRTKCYDPAGVGGYEFFKIQSAAAVRSSTITASLSGSGDFRSSFAP